jgi:hypothetical protein
MHGEAQIAANGCGRQRKRKRHCDWKWTLSILPARPIGINKFNSLEREDCPFLYRLQQR